MTSKEFYLTFFRSEFHWTTAFSEVEYGYRAYILSVSNKYKSIAEHTEHTYMYDMH